MKQDFLSILNFSQEQVLNCIELAGKIKQQLKAGELKKVFEGKIFAMIFHKSSLRTRISFEKGIFNMGGHPMFLTKNDFDIGKRESVEDVAKVMSKMVDMILIRTYDHQQIETLASFSEIPVVNMLTDMYHPCQIMADAFTIAEHLGEIKGKKIVYLGDGNNVANSWLALATRVPIELVIATSKGTQPLESLVAQAKENNPNVSINFDPQDAVKNADIVYTDVWASMGEKNLSQQKEELLQKFQINSKLLALAKKECLVMHCLPAERGREITDEIMNSKQAIVFDQAENRTYAQMAILTMLQQ